jgi:hypothetical protein
LRPFRLFLEIMTILAALSCFCMNISERRGHSSHIKAKQQKSFHYDSKISIYSCISWISGISWISCISWPHKEITPLWNWGYFDRRQLPPWCLSTRSERTFIFIRFATSNPLE